MALKDLTSNLQNYRYGISSPDRIDAQIDSGVDFFDNQESGVTAGFTTKVVPGQHQTEYLDSLTETILGSGFLDESYIPNANKVFDSVSLLDRLSFQTSFDKNQSMTFTEKDFVVPASPRAPHLIIQPATDDSPQAFNWSYDNQPSQNFTQTLDSGEHKSYFDNLKQSVSGLFDSDFINVPSGLNQSNIFGTSTFREVANTGPDEGKLVHPIILRPLPIGDSVVSFSDISTENSVSNLFGVSELNNTYLGASYVDSIRLQKLYDSDGLIVEKQKQLQKYNTFVNTRELQPLSIIGKNEGVIDNPFLKPQRHLDIDSFTISSTQTISDEFFGLSTENQATTFPGAFTPDFSSQNATEIINSEVEVPLGTGQNGISRLFKTSNFIENIVDAYPNRYGFSKAPGDVTSTAPVKISNGIPSFSAQTKELAKSDADKIVNRKGGNFNKESNESMSQRYATLAYGQLSKKVSYYNPVENSPGNDYHMESPKEVSQLKDEIVSFGDDDKLFGFIPKNVKLDFGFAELSMGDDPQMAQKVFRLQDNQKKIRPIGDPGKRNARVDKTPDNVLGVIKTDGGNYTTDLTDRINMLQYAGPDGTDNELTISGETYKQGNTQISGVKDLIKFRFFDITNNKYIVFRALLSGIQDTITTDYNEEKYLGRPDKLYTYKGADRQIAFSFKVYPKTKQELPILIEKLNYLIGLCYPNYTPGTRRMTTPYIQFTLGDMFVDAGAVLRSLTVTVEDNTTWETQNGLQFPKHINCACTLSYLGPNKSAIDNGSTGLTSQQKFHYDGIRFGDVIDENSSNALTLIFGEYPAQVGMNNLPSLRDEAEDFIDSGLEALGAKIKSYL